MWERISSRRRSKGKGPGALGPEGREEARVRAVEEEVSEEGRREITKNPAGRPEKFESHKSNGSQWKVLSSRLT